jgi:GTPase SAR1 family protein
LASSPYEEMLRIIEQAAKEGWEQFDLSNKGISDLPIEISQLTNLQRLYLRGNRLTELPETITQLTNLHELALASTQLTELPETIGQLTNLQEIYLRGNRLTELPETIGQLTNLREIYLSDNQLTELPETMALLENLWRLDLGDKTLNPELATAYQEGLGAVKTYLRSKSGMQVVLNEVKLILIGEGGVGKTCLMDALQGLAWQEHDNTHGINIRSFRVVDPDSGAEITINGWDFGGQPVYRSTHQLFFSASAIYLVVWKPREGTQQGSVREWIRLVKHREPDAKILVVATHDGPQQHQPDIDRQELWDLFGKEMVLGFFHVDSKPDEYGKRRGIEELKQAIAHVASTLPEMGRSIPESWRDVRVTLAQMQTAYLKLERVLELCRTHQMDDNEAHLFFTILHRLGYLIHYQHDPALRDIVILKPDWLATAISYVLNDKVTREAHGLVSFFRLNQLWDDPGRAEEFRYPLELHPLFLRLMERFDLSYKVALPKEASDPLEFWEQVYEILNDVSRRNDELANLQYTSLIGQLVPDIHPERD